MCFDDNAVYTCVCLSIAIIWLIILFHLFVASLDLPDPFSSCIKINGLIAVNIKQKILT